jgi:hypothetical protein
MSRQAGAVRNCRTKIRAIRSTSRNREVNHVLRLVLNLCFKLALRVVLPLEYGPRM